MVIRISTASNIDHYSLASSRPCISCMYKIKNSIDHGYKISKVYFSNENGEIVCYKLRDIIREKQFLSKFYRVSNIPKAFRMEFN